MPATQFASFQPDRAGRDLQQSIDSLPTNINPSLLPFVFNISPNSIRPSYLIAPACSQSNLWQLENADRGMLMGISNIETADIKSLHLLTLDYCGKTTVITPLSMSVS